MRVEAKPKMPKRSRLAKTSDRGYGWQHQRERARWQREVDRGDVDCAHCGLRIEPGTPWDLGHDDNNRTRYVGPEHSSCNRRYRTRREQERAAVNDPEPKPWTPGPETTSGSVSAP